MPQNHRAGEQSVFDAYENLRAFAVPDDEWLAFEQGKVLSWPSTIEGATDVLWTGERQRFGWPKANLSIQFDSEVGTNFVFQPDIGKITLVQRTLGASSIRSVFVQELRKFVLPRERPSSTDYSILAEQLQSGANYFVQ